MIELSIVRKYSSLKSMSMFEMLTFQYFDTIVKAKEKGLKVAWTNVPTPLELFFANDVIPLEPELISAGLAVLQVDTQKILTESEKYISKDCCSFQRHVIGNYFLGGFPKNPDMIVSTNYNSCDAQGKVFELLNYYEKKPMIYIDFGAEENEDGIEYVKAQLLHAADFIGYHSKYEEFNEENLKEMIKLSNQSTDLYRDIYELRAGAKPPPTNSYDGFIIDVINMTNKCGNFNDCISLQKKILKEIKERTAKGEGVVDDDALRIMWFALPPLYNLGLFEEMFEQNNATVVYNELFLSGCDRIEGNDLFEGLAKKYTRNLLNDSIEKRIKMDLEAAKKYKIDAAIHYSLWGCRPLTSGAPSVQRAFQDEDIPFLILDGDPIDPSQCSEGQIKTRLEAFLEMIR
ncbi:MAG: 2-hydroxyacyl-CoA dehydratase [Candidatus Helarchaeota archaeon]|nr:2-hydroxyacyl-CoA dehydratase [Candidatus Helarchaeota archaeon]